MHDEDCKYGLRVKNNNGDTWNCYGDKYLMKSWNQQNREKVVQAMNKSVHQVHKAYRHPNATIDTSEVTDIIPFVDPARQNNKPLFVMKNSKLHRRTNVRDLSDATTTDDWWHVNSYIIKISCRRKNQPSNTTPIVENTIFFYSCVPGLVRAIITVVQSI